jgi:broad specificity phosphatase PhoE
MYFKRIKPFLDEVCKSKNKQILIVSHSWVGRLFRYYFTNDKSIIQLTPKNLEIISFEIKN